MLKAVRENEQLIYKGTHTHISDLSNVKAQRPRNDIFQGMEKNSFTNITHPAKLSF